jgi:hypothetical protein
LASAKRDIDEKIRLASASPAMARLLARPCHHPHRGIRSEPLACIEHVCIDPTDRTDRFVPRWSFHRRLGLVYIDVHDLEQIVMWQEITRKSIVSRKD